MKPFAVDAEMASHIELIKTELLIVLTRRLGGHVALPILEVDATDGLALTMTIDADNRQIVLDVVGRDGLPTPTPEAPDAE